MASFGASAALRSQWGDLIDSAPAPSPDIQNQLRSVVGWLKQASLEVRAAGSRAVTSLRRGAGGGMQQQYQQTPSDTITIVHYNDVYNVDQTASCEPVGGALRFVSAVRALQHLQPLVLFSGDAFSPSMLSTITKGEQMVPVLNAIGTHCAVFGNHDFDFGVEQLCQLSSGCTFPWLMSNVVDRETGRPLADGRITHAETVRGRRIGIIGLVEQEWLDTLATIDPDEVTFIDFVQAGDQLADQLKQEGCDMVVALTHMRTRNDIVLAERTTHIDLILGGHDHVYEVHEVNNKFIVKSGTDFRQFSKITVEWSGEGGGDGVRGRPLINVECCDVTSSLPEDEDLKPVLDKYNSMVDSKMGVCLGTFAVPLEGRFSYIRREETNLGSWLCDVLLAATHADLVILNSGTFRSDRVHPAGEFTLRDLASVIPMRDPILVVEITGRQLVQALDNSVSLYPSLEGRFPQVAGVSFAFDPNKPSGHRVISHLVKVGDEYVEPDNTYRLCIKEYLHAGNDGYTVFKDCPVLVEADMCPEIGVCVQNHFEAIQARIQRRHSAHRQSLVPLSRRHSLVKRSSVSGDGGSGTGTTGTGTSPLRRAASLYDTHPSSSTAHTKLSRRASLDDLEQQWCELAPKPTGRILVIQSPEMLVTLELERTRLTADSVIAEDDETEH